MKKFLPVFVVLAFLLFAVASSADKGTAQNVAIAEFGPAGAAVFGHAPPHRRVKRGKKHKGSSSSSSARRGGHRKKGHGGLIGKFFGKGRR
uniref:Uncharacterized protein n=1 Tax=Globodera rostochiensis TaxID=31243 RepID=A0A914I1W7_GLORO